MGITMPAIARKRLVGVGAAFIASAVLSGCSGPFVNACPAIGCANTLTVTLEGGTDDVSLVQLCIDDECSTPAPGQPYSVEPVPTETLGPTDLKKNTRDPSAVTLPYFASKINDRSWEIVLSMSSPESVSLRAFSASGAVLADEDVTLTWIRVGGPSPRWGGSGGSWG
jgi:hypothetical protein